MWDQKGFQPQRGSQKKVQAFKNEVHKSFNYQTKDTNYPCRARSLKITFKFNNAYSCKYFTLSKYVTKSMWPGAERGVYNKSDELTQLHIYWYVHVSKLLQRIEEADLLALIWLFISPQCDGLKNYKLFKITTQQNFQKIEKRSHHLY